MMKRKLWMALVLGMLAALLCAGGALALDDSGAKEHVRENPECLLNTNRCSNDDGHYYYCNRHKINLSDIEPHYGGEGNATCTWYGECELCSHPYVPRLGHDYQNYVYNGDATCTQDGTGKCIRCEATDTCPAPDSIQPHTAKAIPAVAPTCEQTGLTAGEVCAVCNAILTAQQIVPATGHDYRARTIDPTCTHGGYTEMTCANCNDAQIDHRTARLGH